MTDRHTGLPLPPPATGAELYLAAILEEVRALRRDLAERPPAPPVGTVEVREPVRPPPDRSRHQQRRG